MDEALTDSTYLILLALLKPKHGYVIMKQIHELSQGTFEIGPATMYTILKKLTKKGWIDLEESVDRKKSIRLHQKEDRFWRKIFSDANYFIKSENRSSKR
jgi:DNA-binding PadR family transcriptional regulator